MSWLLFCKDSANREQSKTCFNYAEVQPIFASYYFAKIVQTESRVKLVFNYAEVQPIFAENLFSAKL